MLQPPTNLVTPPANGNPYAPLVYGYNPPNPGVTYPPQATGAPAVPIITPANAPGGAINILNPVPVSSTPIPTGSNMWLWIAVAVGVIILISKKR